LTVLQGDDGSEISVVTSLTGAAALFAAISWIVSFRAPRREANFSSISFAIFLFIVAIHSSLNLLGDYAPWPYIPNVLASIVTAVLLWLDL